MKQELVCEVCRQTIGYFRTDEVVEPITGAMFSSKDPVHGFPPPFRSPGLGFEDMTCPYCIRRPFFTRGLILTENGYWSIKEEKIVSHTPRTGLLDRSEVEELVKSRPISQERLRTHLDPERISEIDHRLAPTTLTAEGISTEVDEEEEKSTDAQIAEAGDQSSEPEVIVVKKMSPEERREEAQRRIALDALEEEKSKHKFPCPMVDCDKGYGNKSNLQRHINTKHGTEESGGENGRSTIDSNAEVGVAEGATSS